MKAIVQTGPESIEVDERERPTATENDVLVHVHTAALCGSDIHAYNYEGGYEWIKLPRVMGHEYSGEVVEVGSAVEEFHPGDPVIEEPIHDCGHCFQCKNGQSNVCQNFSITGMHRDGAYTKFTVVDAAHLHEVPTDIPLKHAAITEPTSIATRAVLDQSRVLPGETVLVEGPGPIGVLTAMVAHSLGANVLVSGIAQDAEYRLPLLQELGIDTIDVTTEDLEAKTDAMTDGLGFDVAFDTTGHKTGVEMATVHVRKGGQIVVVGLPGESSDLFFTPLVRGEVELNTSYGSTWRNFEQALRLMENGAIQPERIIDPSFDAERPEAAIQAFLRSETCKPVFNLDEL